MRLPFIFFIVLGFFAPSFSFFPPAAETVFAEERRFALKRASVSPPFFPLRFRAAPEKAASARGGFSPAAILGVSPGANRLALVDSRPPPPIGPDGPGGRNSITEGRLSLDYEAFSELVFFVLVAIGCTIYYGRKQKKLLDKVKSQNVEIGQAIHSASLLQRSIKPSDEFIAKFFDSSFCVWEPRGDVGGDIYFVFKNRAESVSETVFFLVDCAGHGISGAFLTMLVKSMCDQAMWQLKRSNSSASPSEILRHFQRYIASYFSNDRTATVSFDCGVVCHDSEKGCLLFSGANIPLHVFQNGEMKILKPARITIGLEAKSNRRGFADREIKLSSPTRFYLSSDGFKDQIGGEKGFPLGHGEFSRLLSEVQSHPFGEHKERLMQSLKDYQGKSPRVDDLTLFGAELLPAARKA